jgi:hypothetical protein
VGELPSWHHRSVFGPPRPRGPTCTGTRGAISDNWRWRWGDWEGARAHSSACSAPAETAAYILAAAGWITGLVQPAVAALVLVTSIGAGIVAAAALWLD